MGCAAQAPTRATREGAASADAVLGIMQARKQVMAAAAIHEYLMCEYLLHECLVIENFAASRFDLSILLLRDDSLRARTACLQPALVL